MSFIREVEHLQIPLPHILLATNNFDEKNFIAVGGFGKVYQGQSEQFGAIAIKRLYRGSGQGQHEFMMEIALLSAYKHENLVSLVGFCDQDDEKILVYKHESNGSLDKVIPSKDLNWIQHLRICLDAAKGLKYLQHDVGPQHRVLHRDIKSSNILLDENWKAKISDFGLSKISPVNVAFTFLISNACGTIVYVDPGYLSTGVLTQKSDVYSFGVVLFEVLCGRLACGVEYQDKRQPLFKLAKNHYENGTLNEIIDFDLRKQMDSGSLSTFSTIAYQCLKKRREDRPTMSQVVTQLQNALDNQLVVRLWHHPGLLQEVSTSKGHIIPSRRKREENGGRKKLVVDDGFPEEEKIQKSRKGREINDLMTLLMEDLKEDVWVDKKMKMVDDVQEIRYEVDHEILHLLVYETVVELCRSAWEKPIILSNFFAHVKTKFSFLS